MKKIKTENLTYKLGAVILALLLWFYVYQSQNPVKEQVFNVLIQPMQLSQGLVMVEDNYMVQIRVQGQRRVLEKLQPKEISAYLNLANLEEGEHNLKVYVTLPESLQQVSINPSHLDVRLEALKSKKLPVNIVIDKPLTAADYLMLTPRLEPEEIIVFGPPAHLDEIASAFISLDLANITESVSVSLPIQLKNNGGAIINRSFDMEPSFINVFIPVVAKKPERILPINVPILGTPAPGYQISRIVLEPAQIKAYGDMQLLLDLRALETVPVDITNAKGDFTKKADLILPAGVSVAENKSINVSLIIEPLEQKTINNAVIYHQNIPPGIVIEAKSQTASVTVVGPKSFIEDLKDGEIIPYIDLQGLEVGSYSLPIQVNLPPNISLVSLNPQEDLLTLKESQPQ